MNPVVAEKSGNAPKHTERLNGTGCLCFSHVDRFPTKLIEDSADNLLGRTIVATNEHAGLAALELRIHHAGASSGIECFHEVSALKLALKALHQRLIEIRKESQDTIH